MNKSVSSQVSPILVIRQGRPQKSTGGSLRIVYDLLDEYRRRRVFPHTGYLCASCLLIDEETEDPSSSADQSFAGPDIRRWKQTAARALNRTRPGILAQLARDRRRLRRRYADLGDFRPLVHSHDVVASALLFPVVTGPRITTHHGKGSIIHDALHETFPSVAPAWLDRVFGDLERAGIGSSDVITFPSRAARELFEDDNPGLLEGRRIEIIYNGIRLSDFPHRRKPHSPRSPSGPFALLNVSALVPEKRFDITIETMRELKRRGKNVRLIHIGTGPLAEQYARRVRVLGLAGTIDFLGTRSHPEVLEHLDMCDAFFLPSERVVFDLITLEAMASGRACVLTNAGGNRELVQDKKSGFLCPPGDVRSFADAISSLIERKSAARTLGENARKTVARHFGIDHMVDQYAALYRSLEIDNRRSTR